MKKDKTIVTQAVIIVLIAVFVILIGWTFASRRNGGGTGNGRAIGTAFLSSGAGAPPPGNAAPPKPDAAEKSGGSASGASGAGGRQSGGASGAGGGAAGAGGAGDAGQSGTRSRPPRPDGEAGGMPGGPPAASGMPGGPPADGAGGGFSRPAGGASGASGAGGASGGQGGGSTAGGSTAGSRQTPGTAVRVQTAALGSIENTIVVNGDVMAARQVQIYPISAGKIIQLPVRLGEQVRQGQVVAVIDPSRPGEVYQSSPVRSTINGSLLQLPYVLGEQVSVSQAVAVVGDLSSLVVETFIPERFSQAMRPGLGADIFFDSLPDEVFKTAISEISPIIDPASRTLRIRLRFTKPDARVKSGMFATVSLVTASRSNIPVLPREAVINTYGSWIIFVIDDTGGAVTARRREITLGMESETTVEISSGIKTGERVVISGQNFLSDGDTVRIIQ